MWKKCTAVLLVLLMIASLVGCSMVVYDEEEDRNTVVATVGDAEIKKGPIMDDLKLILELYGLTEGSEGYEEYRASFLEELLDEAITNEAVYQLAAKEGVSLTAEDEAELEAELAEERAAIAEDAAEQAQASFEEDPTIDVEAETQRLIAANEEGMGITDGSYMETARYAKVQEKLKAHFMEDYAPTEAELQEWFEAEQAEQQAAIDADKSKYENYVNSDTVTYVPEGIHYVQNLLIGIPEEARTMITGLRSDGDDEGADARRAEELAKLQDKLAEVEAELAKPGADFQAIMDKYTDDPGMQSEPARTEGYMVYAENTDYDENFVEGAMALTEIGQISAPIESDFGYFILRLVSIPEAGLKSFDECREFVEYTHKNEETSSRYTKALDAYKESIEIVKYMDRLTQG